MWELSFLRDSSNLDHSSNEPKEFKFASCSSSVQLPHQMPAYSGMADSLPELNPHDKQQNILHNICLYCDAALNSCHFFVSVSN